MTGHWEPVGSCSLPGVLSNRKKNLNCFSFLFHYSDQQLFLLQNISFGLGKSTLSKYLAKTQVPLLSVPRCSQGKNPNQRFGALGQPLDRSLTKSPHCPSVLSRKRHSRGRQGPDW